MKAMNTVASHINEMQKIHEEFGAVFDLLISEQTGEKKEVCALKSVPSVLLFLKSTGVSYCSYLFGLHIIRFVCLCVCLCARLTVVFGMITGCRLVNGRFTPPQQRDVDQPVLHTGEVQERATAGYVRFVSI